MLKNKINISIFALWYIVFSEMRFYKRLRKTNMTSLDRMKPIYEWCLRRPWIEEDDLDMIHQSLVYVEENTMDPGITTDEWVYDFLRQAALALKTDLDRQRTVYVMSKWESRTERNALKLICNATTRRTYRHESI